MNYILAYTLFSASSSILTYITIIRPILKSPKFDNVAQISRLKESPFVSFLLLILVFMVLAPAMFIPSLVGLTDEFEEAVYRGLTKKSS